MEALTTDPAGNPAPGPDESWRELAEHTAEHDQVPARPVKDPDRYARFVAWRRAALGLS